MHVSMFKDYKCPQVMSDPMDPETTKNLKVF